MRERHRRPNRRLATPCQFRLQVQRRPVAFEVGFGRAGARRHREPSSIRMTLRYRLLMLFGALAALGALRIASRRWIFPGREVPWAAAPSHIVKCAFPARDGTVV